MKEANLKPKRCIWAGPVAMKLFIQRPTVWEGPAPIKQKTQAVQTVVVRLSLASCQKKDPRPRSNTNRCVSIVVALNERALTEGHGWAPMHTRQTSKWKTIQIETKNLAMGQGVAAKYRAIKKSCLPQTRQFYFTRLH